jgi:hypothetical protein
MSQIRLKAMNLPMINLDFQAVVAVTLLTPKKRVRIPIQNRKKGNSNLTN